MMARVTLDVRRGRNLELYVMAAGAMAVAALSAFGDLLPVDLRWSVAIGGIGLLVYRATVPPPREPVAPVYADRGRFTREPIAARLSTAREVWLFAPSGKNFLSSEHCAMLARVLRRPDAVVRCVLLDPGRTEAVGIAAAQLRCERTMEPLPAALASGLARLRTISDWDLPGRFSCRLLGYNPGFSLLALDPGRGGPIVVELHGVHNESSSARMHLSFTADVEPYWHEYWSEQFRRIWLNAVDCSWE
ncbi:hypothetical protein [Thermomonospora umbrina]|nr:hypothetical protein [Thermomonospora umbrina]